MLKKKRNLNIYLKWLYDYVIYDSDIEKNFAISFESNPIMVKLYAKLPNFFKIDTPLGSYNPACGKKHFDALNSNIEFTLATNINNIEDLIYK